MSEIKQMEKEISSMSIGNNLEETIKTISNMKTKPYLIGISGGSASGKTSVAQVIFKLMGLQDCILISQDSYYKVLGEEQYRNLSEYNFDHPNAFDFDLVLEHLSDLLSGKDVNMPIYNFNVSRREEFTNLVRPCNLIIFEGILALYDKRVRNLMDMKIFVDTDSDVRLARRVYRDIKERGRNLNNVIGRYHKFVKPAFEEFIRPTRKLADVIIPRGAENTVAIDLVAQHLKYQLTKIFAEKRTMDGLEKNSTEDKNCISLSQHELIDPKYQFFDGKVVVSEDSGQIEVLQHIFQDFLNGNNLTYYKLFLDKMINSLLSIYSHSKFSNPSEQDAVITELDNWKLVLNNEGLNSKRKKIVYFQTLLLTEQDFENLENLISENSKFEIHVISVYLSPKFAEGLLSNYTSSKTPANVQFTTLYFNDGLTKYYKYIERGGVMIGDDEGDFNVNSPLIIFKKENFVEYFRNLWKKHF